MNLNFLIQKQHYSRRLEYVMRLIARRLGYPHRIIFNQKDIKPQDTTVTYIPFTEFNNILPTASVNIFNSLGIEILDSAERNIHLFEWKKHSLPVIGDSITKTDLPKWKKDKNGVFYKKRRSDTWIIPCDIFLNVFYHLSRYEEKWRHFTEETATDHSTSILSRHHNLKVPIVDVLVEYLDAILRDRFRQDGTTTLRILNWPAGETFGVAFTHDVDITRGISFKDRLRKTGSSYLQKFLGKENSIPEVRETIMREDEGVWNFNELISDYRAKNWKATFFFISKLMEGRHLRYQIFSKKFRRLIKGLIEENHEVALHPSKFAFDRPRYYREEKKKLEMVCGREITGMRQHFLRAKYPKLWVYAERAALGYDSSIGYNYQAGFRAGTCHPFKTFDVFDNKPLSLTEFSLHLFEYNLPNRGQDREASMKVISDIVHQVDIYHGLLVCLLHPSNYSNPLYKEQWDYLHTLLRKKNIYVNTLANHLNWLRAYERIKVNWDYPEKSSAKIKILLPDKVQNFSIEIIGKVQPDGPKDVVIKKIRKGIYQINSKKQQFSISLNKTE